MKTSIIHKCRNFLPYRYLKSLCFCLLMGLLLTAVCSGCSGKSDGDASDPAATSSGASQTEAAGQASSASADSQQKPQEAAPPDITLIQAAGGNAQVFWNQTYGAGSYSISRRTEDGSYAQVGTADASADSFVDKTTQYGVKYAYRVTAVLEDGRELEGSGKWITLKKIAAPQLAWLRFREADDGIHYAAEIAWEAKEGYSYRIMRKIAGSEESFKMLADVSADTLTDNGQFSYVDDGLESLDTAYTYTVRRLVEGDNTIQLGSFDKDGMTTLNEPAKVSVSYNNMSATIKWDKVSGADGYLLFRRFEGESYERIASLSPSETSYKETFSNALSKEQKDTYCISTKGAEENRFYFMDLSNNKTAYAVRPYAYQNGRISYGMYYNKGSYRLAMPVITSCQKDAVGNVTLTWSRVPHADYYRIYTGYENGEGTVQWTLADQARQAETTLITHNFQSDEISTYYSVAAVGSMNGEEVEGSRDKGFTIKNRSYDGKSVLVLGDSITAAKPYLEGDEKGNYTYQHRLAEMTGMDLYDASYVGAYISYNQYDPKPSIYHDVVERIAKGENPEGLTGLNGRTLEDFDVIILSAGTNDYSKNVAVGKVNTTNTEYLSGALNAIMDKIDKASRARIKAGKAPIQFIYMNIFYGEKKGDASEKNDRYHTVNNAGGDLNYYNHGLKKVMNQRAKTDKVDIYYFSTFDYVSSHNCSAASVDNIHMTKETLARIGNGLAAFVVDEIFTK